VTATGPRGNGAALVAAGLLAIVVAGAVLAPYLARAGYDEQDLASRLKPPLWRSQTRDLHALGTDELGRDVLVRIVYGARVSLAVGVSGVLVGSGVGVLLGLLAGLWRGWVDLLVMRVGDVQLAFPYVLLAIAILAVVGPSLPALIAVLGVRTWVVYARTVRAVVMTLMGREFTEAARALGAWDGRLAFRHLLPNAVAPITVLATAELGNLVLLESTLSFLGLGVQPPMPSWGSMLSTGRAYLTSAWWIATFPGVTMLLVVLAVNVLGDWLRDTRDPRAIGGRQPGKSSGYP
jgi:peptide/nickel transport system permease protein